MAAMTNLAQIRRKIRRLTRSPSPAQITDPQIDEYINTFVLYDFPANIKLDYNYKDFTFYTSPGIDTYETTATGPMTDFKNAIIDVSTPFYVNGNKLFFTMNRDQFYGIYPMVTPQINEQLSNGTNTYTGTLTNFPVLRHTVTFSMTNILGVGLQVHDNGAGVLIGDTPGFSTIDYETGVYTVVFNGVPPANTWVQSSSFAYTAGQPTTILFFDTKFVVRPVPDAVYPIVCNVQVRPTELLNAADNPDLNEWAQYIAFGTSKKIYEDRFDFESANALMPAFKEQEILCLRRTIMQQKDQRAQTIFNGNMRGGYWWNVWN